MSLPIRTSSPAARELAEAVSWYESRHRGLGVELLEEVAKTIQRLDAAPESGESMSSDQKTRRLLVSRFPYQVIYRLRSHDTVIVALAHAKRRPGYWKSRL
ncbi:MAG: type II toxin-antitoxin system RelE/ParE family toxin [Acidobacteria bacterium]|nr:type II toxin-antitoxin system RelE/ParE family toxin [Acidobacteriota bacterium]